MTDDEPDDCTCPDCLAAAGAAMQDATVEVADVMDTYEFSPDEALCVLAGLLGLTLAMVPAEQRESRWAAMLDVLGAAERGMREVEGESQHAADRITAAGYVHEAGTA